MCVRRTGACDPELPDSEVVVEAAELRARLPVPCMNSEASGHSGRLPTRASQGKVLGFAQGQPFSWIISKSSKFFSSTCVNLKLVAHGLEGSNHFQVFGTRFWGRRWQMGRPGLLPRPRRSQSGLGLRGWRAGAICHLVVPQLPLLLSHDGLAWGIEIHRLLGVGIPTGFSFFLLLRACKLPFLLAQRGRLVDQEAELFGSRRRVPQTEFRFRCPRIPIWCR